MKTITTFNFLTSSSAAPTVVKMKGYLVCLLMLLSALPAFSQNGTYILGTDGTTFSTGATAVNTPFMAGRQNYKLQYLYTAEEFSALPNNVPLNSGPRTIRTLAFNVTSLPNVGPVTIKGLRIKIGNYAQHHINPANFGDEWNSTNYPGQIEVVVPDLRITETGWAEIDLGAGFVWDGDSNVIVEICRDSPAGTDFRWTNPMNTDPEMYNPQLQNYGVQATTITTIPVLVRGMFTNNPTSGNNGGVMGCSMVNGVNVNTTNNSKAMNPTDRKIRPVIRFTFSCSSMGQVLGGTPYIKEEISTGGCRQYVLDIENETEATGVTYEWERSPYSNFSVLEPLPDANNETIMVSQTTSTRFYRRKTICSGEGTNSTSQTIPGPTSNVYDGVAGTWSGGIPGPNSDRYLVINGGTFTLPTDAKACGCAINSGGILTVPSGMTLQIDGHIKINSGTILFQDDASLLQVEPGAVNTGAITYQRKTAPISPFDYTYWSSPVQGQTLVGLSPQTMHDKFWRFNESIQNWSLENKNNVMIPGRGYIIRAPEGHAAGQLQLGQFIGKPNNGNITTPISLGTGRFNLIGNPYPSAISTEDVYNANADKIDGTFYYWTHHTPITGMQYSATDYAVHNLMGSVIASPSAQEPNGHIAAGQSVMVKAKDGTAVGASTLLFTNTMRRGGTVNSTFFRAAENNPGSVQASMQKHRVWLDMNNAQGFKQLMVGYAPNATLGYDDAYDGRMMAGTVLSFYSKAGDEQLSIQARPAPFDMTDEVPLGFSTTLAGVQTIKIAKYDGLFTNEDVAILLEDKVLGVTHNLRTGSYTFMSTAGSFPNRFVLKYGTATINQSLSVNEQFIDAPQDIIAFKNSTDLHVATANANLESVKIFDLSGRLLATQTSESGKEIIFSNPQWTSQVLIVQAVMTDRAILTKKVVF